ncbi:MAG: DUF1036 domain-containing protein [Alphaproteobacteria bacterium]|nr:DUF1036 domain-containing protein [Alphaproteobacteria bacterium]
MLTRWIAACVLALCCAFAPASPASASMTVCNRTSYVLYTALGAASKSDIAAQGWSRVAPGGCAVVLNKDLTAAAYYLYARSSQAHSGTPRAWGGGMNLCVKDTNFASRDALTARDCQSDDFFQLPFAQVDTHHLKSWTTTLSESPTLSSLPQAQLAGLKRLLRDVGYKIAAIDGKPDPATDKAIADFRKKLRLAPTASIGDLFDALETEAMKTASPQGYSVCNDTAKAVAAALGQKQRNDWVSHGWWKIGAGSCARLAGDLTGFDSLYLFVQKINGPPLVTGPNKLCVADIQFDIQGRGRCAARGLTEVGFAESKVKGLNGYSVHIGENGIVKPLTRR